MVRKLRIAAAGSFAAGVLLFLVLGGAYLAVRQVRPFYEQALRIEPEVLQRGSRELESRATALYSEAQQQGQWHALFTAEQINGWLAIQLSENEDRRLPTNIRDPRVAIAPDVLTLGFRTTSGGVDTVITLDAAVFLTDEGSVAIRFKSVRAGALPLPVLPLAEELAAACKQLRLPVSWTQQDGQPVAIVQIHSDPSADKLQFFIDSIELGDGELYVAGHTTQPSSDVRHASGESPQPAAGGRRRNEIKLTDYELQLTPNDERSALKIARRTRSNDKDDKKPAGPALHPASGSHYPPANPGT